jgi:tRNA-specific 2-thiouridylase
MDSSRKKVVIAMSGGVDSSVAAALLVQQGYEVTGMMLKLWSDDCDEAENACCPPEAINQARQVANLLGIPFYVLDVQKEFKQQVVDRFIEALNLGLTPNPCYLCNQKIRWGVFIDRVLDSGIAYFATGHYAQVEAIEGAYALRKGLDPKKDQSYVLSGLSQEQLSHTILPLGKLTKPEVRQLAHQFNLPVAEKHDSQDLCFIGKAGYREFLKRNSPNALAAGEIRTVSGTVVGSHAGLVNYTIGQRKGLGAGNAEPVYVVEKDTQQNAVIIGTAADLGKDRFQVVNLNWIQPVQGQLDLRCEVKIRYKALPVSCVIHDPSSAEIQVQVEHPLRDITPGQIAVFYAGDTVIGSGMIKSVSSSGGKE